MVHVALLALGCTATASQVLLLREFLVAFQGNELLLGIFLGNWLLLEAVGTAVARSGSDRTARPTEVFALLQIALGLGPVAGILILRSFKAVLGIPTGEVLGMSWGWLVSAVAILPTALADGAAFLFGCRMLLVGRDVPAAAGRVYALTAAGSVLGGLLFLVPLVYSLSPLLVAGLLCLGSAGSVLGLFVACRGPVRFRRLAFGLAVGVAFAVGGSVPDRLDTWSARLQWHDHVLLETARSPYATIAVVRATDQLTFFVNGSPSITVPHPGPEVEVLAHFAMLLHARPARVLVIGGGAGGLLRELLRHGVEEITYAEQDPLLIETLRQFPTSLTLQELTHPNVRLHPVEGRLFLRQGGARWDLILLNLPAPLTLMLNRYYTEEFFALARSRLSDGGLLAFALPGSETLLSPELAALNGSVHAALRTVFRHVRVLAGDPNLFLAWDGETPAPEWDEHLLVSRLRERGIRTGLVTETYIRYRLDRKRFAELVQAFAIDEPANRDGLPRGTFASMRVFARTVSPALARSLEALDGLPASAYPATLVALVASLLGLQARRRKPWYVGYAAATTGFAGMATSVVLILAFQIQYGDVYQYVGLLTALFMLGAAIGSVCATRRHDVPILAIESALLVVLLIAYGCVVFGPRPELWLPLIFAFMAGTGGIAGAQYPVLVAGCTSHGGKTAAVAARIYFFDLMGAVLGAALAGVVFIPTIGITGTLLVAAALKAGSVVLICAARGGRQPM
jgi:spermidine synthase